MIAARVHALDPALGPEAYRLEIGEGRILLEGSTPSGLHAGLVTLRQLWEARGTPERTLPRVRIEDHPRFSYRGLHLDVARHFFPRNVVLRLLQRMELFKFDVLHLHLTDDQGFRIPIASHPELVAVGSRRDGDGHEGSFSAEDLAILVAEARRRFITILPEIDVPGHARAILASHPELSCRGQPLPVPSTWGIFDDVLCAGDDRSAALVRDVLRDTASLFPGPWLHIGGDEVPPDRYRACPRCRARATQEKLLDPAALHGVFLAGAAADVRALGRRPVVWDEGAEAAGKDALVMAWRSMDAVRDAARRGQDVVAHAYTRTYFNLRQSELAGEIAATQAPKLTWQDVLSFDPVPEGLDPGARAHVIGAQGALWTEHIRDEAGLESALFPRLLALSEVLWSPAGDRSQADFVARYVKIAPMLERLGIRGFIEAPRGLPEMLAFSDTATLTLSAPELHPGARISVTLSTRDRGMGSVTTIEATGPLVVRESALIEARTILTDGRQSLPALGRWVKEALRPAVQVSAEPEPGLRYRYVEGGFTRVPEVASLPSVQVGILKKPEIPINCRKEDYALELSGLVHVPGDGPVAFQLTADDGARLDVDGLELIDLDGVHAPQTRLGQTMLARGFHRVRLRFFQAKGGAQLALDARQAGASLPFLHEP